MEFSRSRELANRAKQLMPAGVNSPVRAFQAVGGDPLYIASAQGATVTDVDGNSYVDYVCSWGPLILGHAHPEVISAVHQAVAKGTSYGAPHEGEIRLAESIVEAMPWIERLRFVNSGTEATMSALRLARAATGRAKIIKFEGNYHGHVDYLLAKAGSGVATFGLPDTAGVSPEVTRDTLIAPFNHLEAVEKLFEAHAETIAAVIVEPVAGNMGVVAPRTDFLEGLRQLTRRFGALLVFDEVITGFRVSRSGAAGRYGIQPDLVCLGKIIGGGLPVGAYGGREEIMQLVAPTGSVYQAGTLSGNPLAMAAGWATLHQLTPDVYSSLEAKAGSLEEGFQDALKKTGISGHVNRVGSMLSLFFTEHPVNDSESALKTNRSFYARCFHALLRQGIYAPPSALETWFVSTAHTSSHVARTIEAFSTALHDALASAGRD